MSNPNDTAKALIAKLDTFTTDVRAAKTAGLPHNIDVTEVLSDITDLKTKLQNV